ncbi:MAG TPA: cupin domain-containing protein [Terriglobales bacterium]|nr:cupin domain-containing protein [Terriglobales bacterium]
MKRMYFLLGITLALGVALGVLSSRLLSAQEQLKGGTVLKRADVAGAQGMEAILVLRELPPGAESGKHTQSGTEIVYILDGSSTLEIAGKPAQTLKPGEAFSTTAGQVHNVKNASASAPARALAFYIAKKGARLEDLSRPAE